MERGCGRSAPTSFILITSASLPALRLFFLRLCLPPRLFFQQKCRPFASQRQHDIVRKTLNQNYNVRFFNPRV